MQGIVAKNLTILCCTILLSQCAVPVAPTGGPTDDKPPTLVSSEPENGSTNFAGDEIRIRFSEYVDQRSFSSALTITPQPISPPSIRWNKKTVVLRFAEPLLSETTYLVQLSNSLADVNRVKIRTPITLAFSTGDQIDSGIIRGRVVDFETGSSAEGIDMFAYADSVTSRLTAPIYATQSNPDGSFEFKYLSERDYVVVGARDVNRNRLVDANEPVAITSSPRVSARPDTLSEVLTWILHRNDTTRPTVRTASALSSTRGRIRFSENVFLPAESTDEDSVALYQPPDTPNELHFRLQNAVDTLQLSLSGLVDSTGNVMADTSLVIPMSSVSDTVNLRLLDFRPRIDTQPLSAANPLVVTLSDVITLREFEGFVGVTDTSGATVSYSATVSNGVEGHIYPRAANATRLVFSFAGEGIQLPDSTVTESFDYVSENRLGAIEVTIATVVEPTMQIHLVDDTASLDRVVRATAGNSAVLKNLIEDSYGLRFFYDLNNDRKWNPGNYFPHVAHEPVGWIPDTISVRLRFDTILDDSLRIPMD